MRQDEKVDMKMTPSLSFLCVHVFVFVYVYVWVNPFL